MTDYFQTFHNLHNIYSGTQDNGINQLITSNKEKHTLSLLDNNSTFIKKHIFTIKKKNNNNIVSIFIDLQHKEVATNFQINNLHLIESISLIIGFQPIDKIYTNIFDTLRKIYNMNANEIPMYMFKLGLSHFIYHGICINIKYKNDIDLNDVILSADIYSNLEIIIKYDKIIHLIQYLHFNNNKSLNYINNIYQRKYSLNFNHPVYCIILNTKCDGEVYLELSNKKIKLLNLQDEPNIKVLPLTKLYDEDDILNNSINFSKVDKCNICLESDNQNDLDNEIEIFALSLNIIRNTNGMAGLAYAS